MAVMCAAVLWWRCHRRFIADVVTSVVTSLGTTVVHIRDERNSEAHKPRPPVRFVVGGLTYASR